MEDYFGEYSTQVVPSDLVAFGIPISSRYGDASELAEMLGFTEQVARRNVSIYVKRVFYDSKQCWCLIDLDPSVQEGDVVADEILKSATETIGQFLWFGLVQHGGAVLASESADQE